MKKKISKFWELFEPISRTTYTFIIECISKGNYECNERKNETRINEVVYNLYLQ